MTRKANRLPLLLFPLLIGTWLLIFGVWAGVAQWSPAVLGIETMWPMILIAAGSLFLLGYLTNRRAFGLVLPGTAAVLLGGFFFLFSAGITSWSAMEVLWPCFPLIAGASFVAMWLAAFCRYWGLLIPASLGIATGLIGLTLTLTPLGALLGFVGWPLALLSTGAALILLTLVAFVSRTLRSAVRRD